MEEVEREKLQKQRVLQLQLNKQKKKEKKLLEEKRRKEEELLSV